MSMESKLLDVNNHNQDKQELHDRLDPHNLDKQELHDRLNLLNLD